MKRLSVEAKMTAYNEAVNYLRSEECSYDKDEDRAARKWLADKLDAECDRWLSNLRNWPPEKESDE